MGHDKNQTFSSNKLCIFSLVIIFAGMGASHLTAPRASNIPQASTPIEVSEQTTMASRSTELSTPKKLKRGQGNSLIIMQDKTMNQKWGLKLTESKKAWRVSQGSKKIVVAVIDTGIDIRHPDLKGNLWQNPGESGRDALGRNKATNGLDDDGNGMVDDVHGWDFVSNTKKLTDNHGHGTHIAGIIGAEGKKEVIGVAPKISLMILKYYDPKSAASSNLNNTVRAIDYAVQKGAHIINYSGGGLQSSLAEKEAIRRAKNKGVLFIAAAGNERSNSDQKPYYPADYDFDNIVSVTAINKSKQVLPSSNYGVSSVDLAAPGNQIKSTLPGGVYGKMTGTSQATAFVTGVAALLMANNPDLKAAEVKKFLLKTGDLDPSLIGKTRYKRRLNSYRALTILDQGMALNGVIAENTTNMKSGAFSIGADLTQIPANGLSAFKDITQHLVTDTPRKIADKNEESPL